MEPCGCARLRGVNSIHRPEHANRQNKRLNGQADRLNGFSVEIAATRTGQAEETKRASIGTTEANRVRSISEAHEAWLYL